jgi:hypothetical protein
MAHAVKQWPTARRRWPALSVTGHCAAERLETAARLVHLKNMRTVLIAALAVCLTALPAQAMTITARVSGGNIAIHTGPHHSYPVVGRLADGAEIPIDECTQVDSDSRRGTLGDAGYPLWGNGSSQWCHIPETGWVERSWIVGRGLVNVTPPDFAGSGW